jgi:hypothetical protein
MHDQLTCQPGREADGPVLRHGFSYGHVQALARRAMRDHGPSQGMDPGDRFEAAWGAIAEYLYTTQQPPTPLDLIIAGRAGLSRLRKGYLREQGYAYRPNGSGRDPAAGPMSAPSFLRYWHRPLPPTPEDMAVDRTALWQVLAVLAPVQAQALLALAEQGDREGAAAALGLADSTFRKRLGAARAAFLVLWHEHEAPSGTWRQDKRAGRVLRRQPAGHADAARTLGDIAGAFGGRTRIGSLDLLARLAAADPGRYGGWDLKDLAGFLRLHGVTRHKINIDGDRRDKRWGHWLEDITSALAELTAASPAGRAARPLAA